MRAIPFPPHTYSRFRLAGFCAMMCLLLLPAQAADVVQLLDGTRIEGRIVLPDHHGTVIMRSERSGLARSVAHDWIQSMTRQGQRQELNPPRPFTEEEREALPEVVWGDGVD